MNRLIQEEKLSANDHEITKIMEYDETNFQINASTESLVLTFNYFLRKNFKL